jgi:high-affinity nickel permease
MDNLLLPSSGIGLMLLLGLRHGFDPDHIAIIDSMAYRAVSDRPGWPRGPARCSRWATAWR